MRKAIGCILITFLFFSTLTFSFGNSRIVMLQDIENHWIAVQHKEALYLLQHLGIIKGYEDRSFRPQNQVSRQEFVTMLIKTLEPRIEASGRSATFKDVTPMQWGFPYVERAVEKGILLANQYENQLFQPEKPITRLEIATMIMMGLGIDIEKQEVGEKTTFLDDEEIPMEAKPYIQMVSERGIVRGYGIEGGYEFRPSNTVTRAEAVVMIYRVLQQKTDLKQVGYYAIQSSAQANAIPLEKIFDEIIFGWSSLDQLEDGTIIFSMNSTSEYRRPIGYEQALDLVDNKNLDRKLMLTETRTSLIYSLLENKQYQRQVIDDIVKSLKEYGFTGIVMDLENIRNQNQGYRSLYVEFLEELKKGLKAENYTLTVTVQPNNVVGYYDGYDFKRISEIADEINIMAHDYHEKTNLNILTDHAPLPLVQEALVRLLEAGVDPEKVILGLQVAAGTQWVTTVKEAENTREFFTPAMGSVYRAVTEREGEKSFDFSSMTPAFQYRLIEEGIESQRFIRYEDKKSMESKLLLAKYYGIKGISIWRIGEIQEDIVELLKQRTSK